MNKELYEMIFKRKSFHLFRNIGNEKISFHIFMNVKEKLKHIFVHFYPRKKKKQNQKSQKL